MWYAMLRTSRMLQHINSMKVRNLWLNSGARSYTLGEPGSGAGRGGGAGGSIKESGGGLGKYGTAQEEGYFYQKTKEELERLKKKLSSNPEGQPAQTPEIKKKEDDPK